MPPQRKETRRKTKRVGTRTRSRIRQVELDGRSGEELASYAFGMQHGIKRVLLCVIRNSRLH
jgi:hypothetical protein